MQLGGHSTEQAALFPESNSLLDELGRLDIDGLSLIEALNRLFEWKKKTRKMNIRGGFGGNGRCY